ncbi:PRC-barrel domain-containing protein [Rhodospirillaceae bacterium SYSU D60014]|uniref:PRC-barrel domain-containing protein n=1 Tax=Virgifigura deserti TaxID=2268457 RepID=UPI0013C50394
MSIHRFTDVVVSATDRARRVAEDPKPRAAEKMLVVVSALAFGVSGPAVAQQGDEFLGPDVFEEQLETPEIEDRGEVTDIESWGYDALYDSGWRAGELIETSVQGGDGTVIGDVEDLLVETEGALAGIIVETGGVLDIGDTHLLVPWSDAEVAADMATVSIPVNEENVDDFDLIDGDESVDEAIERTGGWQAASLIGGDVAATGLSHYGTVEDLIFSRKGKLMAVVVDPDDVVDEGGPYAFPYLEDAYDPVYNAYTVPYTPEQAARLQPFDYGAMDTASSE